MTTSPDDAGADPTGQARRGSLPSRLAELTQDLLLGDIWERPGLSKRDRSLVTIGALAALYRTDQLRDTLRRAPGNGVTREEVDEVILHMAFYGGWPVAVNANAVANEVFGPR